MPNRKNIQLIKKQYEMDEGKRKIGRVALLLAAIGGLFSAGNRSKPELMQEKNRLLTNGFASPEPRRMLNQRQKRKRARQMNRY